MTFICWVKQEISQTFKFFWTLYTSDNHSTYFFNLSMSLPSYMIKDIYCEIIICDRFLSIENFGLSLLVSHCSMQQSYGHTLDLFYNADFDHSCDILSWLQQQRWSKCLSSHLWPLPRASCTRPPLDAAARQLSARCCRRWPVAGHRLAFIVLFQFFYTECLLANVCNIPLGAFLCRHVVWNN